MNISQLDRIDNEERYQEIRDELDEFEDDHSVDNDGQCLDVDLSYSGTEGLSEVSKALVATSELFAIVT